MEEVEPIAADVRPRSDERAGRTEHRALLRLAAALLGCRYDDLARRDEERRKAALRKRLASAAALLIMFASGGLWWWDANLRVKTRYCAAYGERWAVPFCIGPLNSSQWTVRTTSYRFRTQGGRVLELARINGSGSLVDHQNTEYEDEPWTGGVAIWAFEYQDATSGSETLPVSATLKGRNGAFVRQITYAFSPDRHQAVARFDRGLGLAERQSAAGASLGLAAFRQAEQGGHSSIGQHRLTFDAVGRLLRRDFEPIGGGENRF